MTNASVGELTPTHVAEPLLLDVRQVAVLLGVCRNTVWKMHSAGTLGPQPVRLGRAVRWRHDEIIAWVEAGCPSREKWLTMRKGNRR